MLLTEKLTTEVAINTSRSKQNGWQLADDLFKWIFLNEIVRISIKISLKFVPKGPIDNNPSLVQIMAWRRLGDKPLSEPMMVRLATHICITRPQWVRTLTSWTTSHFSPSHRTGYGVSIVYILEARTVCIITRIMYYGHHKLETQNTVSWWQKVSGLGVIIISSNSNILWVRMTGTILF